MNSYQRLRADRDRYKAIVDDIFTAAETGGAVLRAAIIRRGGPVVGMYDTMVSNTVAAAVNWRHGPNMKNRTHLTDLDRELISSVDAMLESTNAS